MTETLYDSDFVKYLPQPLTHDPKMIALAKAAAKELLEVSGAVEDVLIYSRIDELPEELIDILAYDMHVDWYDFSYPLAAKRDLLKSSVRVHKKMGTKYAVEKALSALYPESEVEEWFEYEGEPGHFHIVCDVTDSRITASVSVTHTLRDIDTHRLLFVPYAADREIESRDTPAEEQTGDKLRQQDNSGDGSSRIHLHKSGSRNNPAEEHSI